MRLIIQLQVVLYQVGYENEVITETYLIENCFIHQHQFKRNLIHILDIILYIFVGGHIEQTDQDEDTGM